MTWNILPFKSISCLLILQSLVEDEITVTFCYYSLISSYVSFYYVYSVFLLNAISNTSELFLGMWHHFHVGKAM